MDLATLGDSDIEDEKAGGGRGERPAERIGDGPLMEVREIVTEMNVSRPLLTSAPARAGCV